MDLAPFFSSFSPEFFEKVSRFPLEKQYRLYEQLCSYRYDFTSHRIEKMALCHNPIFANTTVFPQKMDVERGRELIEKGKVACILLCGGEGSRLGLYGPKAKTIITPFSHKTLLQYLLEDIAKYRIKIEVVLLISPKGEVDFLKLLSSLPEELLSSLSLTIVKQPLLPFMSTEGNPLLTDDGVCIEAANGSGGVFEALVNSGVIEKWSKIGIEYVNLAPIDNPISEPLHPSRIGLIERLGGDLACSCIPTIQLSSPTGVFVKRCDRIEILEYHALAPNTCVKSAFSNLNLWTFHVSCLKEICLNPLPIHWVEKRCSSGEIGLKGEKIITDAAGIARHLILEQIDHKKRFSPIKYPEDIELAQQAILAKDRAILKEVYGIEASGVELHPKYSIFSKEHKKTLESGSLFNRYIS